MPETARPRRTLWIRRPGSAPSSPGTAPKRAQEAFLREPLPCAQACGGGPRATKMRTPGVQPGSQTWEACMMPLHYMRLWLTAPQRHTHGNQEWGPTRNSRPHVARMRDLGGCLGTGSQQYLGAGALPTHYCRPSRICAPQRPRAAAATSSPRARARLPDAPGREVPRLALSKQQRDLPLSLPIRFRPVPFVSPRSHPQEL